MLNSEGKIELKAVAWMDGSAWKFQISGTDWVIAQLFGSRNAISVVSYGGTVGTGINSAVIQSVPVAKIESNPDTTTP